MEVLAFQMVEEASRKVEASQKVASQMGAFPMVASLKAQVQEPVQLLVLVRYPFYYIMRYLQAIFIN